ncbi:MAG: SufD family Fe-S cluster assembly protein [Desulfurococcales archaeon]|nr:SufD family Fe-S cluster assembly protein [Desulfurococcales archaeon]
MSKKSVLEDIREKALKGLDKSSPYGADVDIEKIFAQPSESSVDYEKKLMSLGIDLKQRGSGTYLQLDNIIKQYSSMYPGVEVLSIEDAVENRWDEIKDFYWRLIDPSTDKYVAYTALRGRGGFYIRAKKGTKTLLPVQACMIMSGGAQLLHNIIVVEEDAELMVLSGCLAALERLSLHVGVSEIYLMPRSKLYFIMIHSWTQVNHVRPRTTVLVGDEAEYIDYYINISDVSTLQTFPKIIVKGDDAKVSSYNIILGSGSSKYDVGTNVVLDGEGSSAQIISRIVVKDSSEVINRLRAEAHKRSSKAYLECNGLLLSENSRIYTIPELDAHHPDTDLYHEASIGRLRDEEIEYLLMKGISYRDAVSMLIRGFIDVSIKIPNQKINEYINKVLDLFASKSSV